jgi:hypothetical protein
MLKPKGMMFSAIVPLGRGGPAKFASPEHERVFEEATGLQIGQEGGNVPIDRRTPFGQILSKAAVLVPGVVRRRVEELHETDAAFHQPPGHQALPPRPAVPRKTPSQLRAFEGHRGFFRERHRQSDLPESR